MPIVNKLLLSLTSLFCPTAKARIDYKVVDEVYGNPANSAGNVIVDDIIDAWGNHWQGPLNTLPAGFTVKFSKTISLDHIVARNGRTTPWKCGTKDFEILLGATSTGPWKSVLNDSMENHLAPPWMTYPDLKRFSIADDTSHGQYLKFFCHSHHPTHVDAESWAPRCSLQYLAIYGSQCFHWC